MKKIYLLSLLLFIISTGYSQTSVIWSSPITVASGYSNIYPRLALMSGDLPLVIWENSTTDKIYSSKWNGSSFSIPSPVHNSGVVPYIATWTGAEIASSGDTAYVVFNTYLSSDKVYSVRSIDGGITFNDTVRIDEATENTPRMPAVAVTPFGNPVVSYMIIDTATMETEYAVANSPDAGLSYSTSIPAPNSPGSACDCCPATIVVNGNNEALLFRNNISNLRNIWASFSSDGGMTFPASAEIDQSNWVISSCPSSGPSGILTNDSLVSTWMSEGTTGDSRIYVGSINTSDQQIGFNKQIYPFGTSTQNFPVIAGYGDTIGIVWQGYNGSFQEVLFSYSISGASGLGINIDTITNGTSGHQSRPHMTYKNGSFHVVFRDSNGANVKYMKGNVSSTTGISEINKNIIITNSFYQNDLITITINSNKNSAAICEVINTLGQKVGTSKLQLYKGNNTYSIPGNYFNGMYYINIITSGNEMSQRKVQIIK